MAEAFQIAGICSVAVQVRNLDRSLVFYRDVLGLHLVHRDGWIAQLQGRGTASPTLVLLELGERTGSHYTGTPGLARVAWQVGRQGDLGDIVDTRDPDRTHVLLVWLDAAQLAGERLPPRLYTYD